MLDLISHFTSPLSLFQFGLLRSKCTGGWRVGGFTGIKEAVHAHVLTLMLIRPQITRSHYQNALTATRMDSSPQTPDAVDPDAKGRPPVPETRSHSIALPLTHAHTRMGLARLAHLHPHGGLRNTSQLNERNRIVRKLMVMLCKNVLICIYMLG